MTDSLNRQVIQDPNWRVAALDRAIDSHGETAGAAADECFTRRADHFLAWLATTPNPDEEAPTADELADLVRRAGAYELLGPALMVLERAGGSPQLAGSAIGAECTLMAQRISDWIRP